MVTFTGEHGVGFFVATTLHHGLRLYANTGMKPSRAWTPKAMMAKASEITGKRFRARDYLGAADAVKEWAEAEKARALAAGQIEGS